MESDSFGITEKVQKFGNISIGDIIFYNGCNYVFSNSHKNGHYEFNPIEIYYHNTIVFGSEKLVEDAIKKSTTTLKYHILTKEYIQQSLTYIMTKKDGPLDIIKCVEYIVGFISSNDPKYYDPNNVKDEPTTSYLYYPISGKLLPLVSSLDENLVSIQDADNDTLIEALKFLKFFSTEEKKYVLNNLSIDMVPSVSII